MTRLTYRTYKSSQSFEISQTSHLFLRLFLPLFLALLSLTTLGLPGVEAKKKQTAAQSDNKNAFQDQLAKSKAEPVNQDLYQTDYSKNFSYILPPGWQVTQNPIYPHDILVKQASEGKGNIVLADQPVKGNLSKMGEDMVDELPKLCDDFKLVSNEMVKLPSGTNCARLMHTGKLGESEMCQVNYLMPYTRGRVLIVTGTVLRGDSDGLATIEKFATSVSMKKKKLSL